MLAHSPSRSHFQEKALITPVIYPLAHKETFIVSLIRFRCPFLKAFLSLLFRPFMLLCSQSLHSPFPGVCSDPNGMQTLTNVRNMVCFYVEKQSGLIFTDLVYRSGQVKWQCTIELPRLLIFRNHLFDAGLKGVGCTEAAIRGDTSH